MLVSVGAVLNYVVYWASYATLLPRFVVVRVAGAHLAIALLVVVDGGHTLVGQELTNRTTNATVLSFVRLVLSLNTNLAFGGTHFIRILAHTAKVERCRNGCWWAKMTRDVAH